MAHSPSSKGLAENSLREPMRSCVRKTLRFVGRDTHNSENREKTARTCQQLPEQAKYGVWSGQKNLRVRKIRVRNSGAGNGCANFMDTWKKCVLSARKPMSIKFRVLGGGFGGGGECRFYFYGREDFSEVVVDRFGRFQALSFGLSGPEISEVFCFWPAGQVVCWRFRALA